MMRWVPFINARRGVSDFRGVVAMTQRFHLHPKSSDRCGLFGQSSPWNAKSEDVGGLRVRVSLQCLSPHATWISPREGSNHRNCITKKMPRWSSSRSTMETPLDLAHTHSRCRWRFSMRSLNDGVCFPCIFVESAACLFICCVELLLPSKCWHPQGSFKSHPIEPLWHSKSPSTSLDPCLSEMEQYRRNYNILTQTVCCIANKLINNVQCYGADV